MAKAETIDVLMQGHERLTAAYLLRGAGETALIDCGPASSLGALSAALAEHGVGRLDWIVLTHVHLDHAGAAGALARRFPGARVAVSSRGARHLADPTRLWEGVRAVYGADAERLWGRPLAVPEERLVAVDDGAEIDLGYHALRAVATPGHAKHHLAWVDDASGDAFVGDALGMRAAADGELWRASTPPAGFELETALESIASIRRQRPRRLFLGHYGAAAGDRDRLPVEQALAQGAETLRAWCDAIASRWSAGIRGEALVAAVAEWLAGEERRAAPGARRLLDRTSPIAIDVAGVAGWLERGGLRQPT